MTKLFDMMKRFLRVVWNYHNLLIIILTPLLLLPLPLVIQGKVSECSFVLCVMAVYWLTEALPLAATALLPALLFPLFGIMKSSQVAGVYFKDFHLLLIGVICLATSIEKWGLHRRISLRLVSLVGVNPGWLMLGFMNSCAFLSMWVQNTSAVAMVMPIVEAIIQQILNAEGEGEQRQRAMTGTSNLGLELEEQIRNQMKRSTLLQRKHPLRPMYVVQAIGQKIEGRYRTKREHMMCKGLCLSIAYASSIGGISTLTGTSPNLIFSEYIHQFYPECTSVNFGNWIVLCLPISIIALLLSWIWLHWMFIGSDFRVLFRPSGERSERETATARVIEEDYNKLGPTSPQEVVTGVMFILMVALWVFRDPGFMPGWASTFLPQYAGYISDATVALLLGLVFFIMPAHKPSADKHGIKYEAMISWKEFQACMPWEVTLLVGGGFALAEGTQVSGLSSWVANLLSPMGSLPIIATVTIACVLVTSVTELASNAATITIFLPILAPLAETIRVNPLYILIPTTLCTSFAFLLPSSNPSNAIVFAYGHLTTMDMVKAGIGVNVISVLAVLLAVTTWGIPLFDMDTYPDWAPTPPTSNITGW
ncbi:solute carrier family 13 member 1-like [Coregonus clupeaformis]|uniref:solute carrier family 13 member 1-like n=1 Tax=Coregonus clupeaformis TaxID=59861 RepID=UPI001BDFF88E|nr:solute carrier family 13 member 1-like [Coregonus clupeaformis]